MRLVIVGLFFLLAVNTLQECRGESFFDEFMSISEKLVHKVKRGAEDVGKGIGENVKYVVSKFGDEAEDAAAGSTGILKKFGIDTENIVKIIRHDVFHTWVKAKPYMKDAFTYMDGVMKKLYVEETSEEKN